MHTSARSDRPASLALLRRTANGNMCCSALVWSQPSPSPFSLAELPGTRLRNPERPESRSLVEATSRRFYLLSRHFRNQGLVRHNLAGTSDESPPQFH